MKEKKRQIKSGLQRKILMLSVSMVVIAIVVASVVGIIEIRSAGKLTGNTSRAKAEIIQETSRDSMLKITRDNLAQTAGLAARLIDEKLWIMEHDFFVLDEQVKDILKYPEKYSEVEVFSPQKENEGKYALQVMYAQESSKTDEKTQYIIRRLANLEPMMSEIVGDNGDFLMDCYIALPDGTVLMMDKFSGQKYSDDGELKHYDVRTREWFKEASSTTEDYVVFMSAVPSYFYDLTEVIFGVPVFIDGEFVAALEGSINLDTIRKMVADIEYGKNGFSILTEADNIIYSPRTEGELSMDNKVSTPVKGKVNKKLEEALLMEKGWRAGFKRLTVDGMPYYASYAPIRSVDWKLVMFIPEEEIERPTNELLSELNKVSADALEEYATVFSGTVFRMVLAFALLVLGAVITSFFFSSRITGPIKLITKKVQEISGENLVFEADEKYKTGDEIEILADAFEDMSERTRRYIKELMEVTSEKERMAAELSVAAKIQEDMLPKNFPMFPERSEFEVFASMKPAKEVGGDFYDIFMIDDDHLALVIGDVSGKGISAALFMVKSKMLIQNRTMMGGTPGEILEDVNEKLRDGNTALMFVTVWLGILTISTGHMIEANAGHTNPAVCLNGECFELIEKKHGSCLGIRPGKKYTNDEFDLSDGSCLFVYTDGVNEAENPDSGQFGTGRMLEVLSRTACLNPEDILGAVSEEIGSFAGGATQFDDITMMAIRWNKKGN
ncbi:MAG: SpoIIE family protein phosphatase [Butyrivibrio sp.]|nr:SpoIIE family protein phosphatase [Butyrivibrio sp.]